MFEPAFTDDTKKLSSILIGKPIRRRCVVTYPDPHWRMRTSKVSDVIHDVLQQIPQNGIGLGFWPNEMHNRAIGSHGGKGSRLASSFIGKIITSRVIDGNKSGYRGLLSG